MWRAPKAPGGLTAVPVGGGGAWQGYSQRPSPTGVEGAGGTGGPGCGARGRWRGQAAVLFGGGRARAGLEIDHSERSSRVAISRAGRRPEHQRRNKQQKWEAAAHGHNQQPGPTAHRRRPEHRWHHKQHDAPAHAKTPPRGCGTGFSLPSRV